MIPGPIDVDSEVLEWMGGPVRVHYGDEWVAAHNETIALLQQVIGTSGKVFIMPGSGRLGLDAVVQTTFAPGVKVAVGQNGHFGHRLTEVLEANGVIPIPVVAQPGEPLVPDDFDRVLAGDPTITAVAVVHLETSTAVLNPVREIAAVARKHNRLCMVDTVSSLGCVPYEMDAWNIDLTVSASQKGLGAAPGVAVVAVGPRAWAVAEARTEPARSWYLDLKRWQWYVENWGDWHPFPVTLPTSGILGLRAALQSLVREGLPQRIQRYEQLAARLREGLRTLGLPPSVDDELMLPCLTAVYTPDGVRSSELVNFLAEAYGIRITTGFAEAKERVIRIGHMGTAITEADIDRLLEGIRQFLAERQTQNAR